MLKKYMDIKIASVIAYEKIIPASTYVDKAKIFNKRLVPRITDYHEEFDAENWLKDNLISKVPRWIRNHKLDYGLIISSDRLIPGISSAVQLMSEPSIKPYRNDSLYLANDMAQYFQHLPDKIPFLDFSVEEEMNFTLNDANIINEHIEISMNKINIKSSPKLECDVIKALDNSFPYKELANVFKKYGHVICTKFTMGGRLTSLNRKYVCDHEDQNEDKYEELHTINWQRMLELLNSYSDRDISNMKIDGINQWLISNSKNPDSWQIINRIQFTPLYKFLGVTLRKEIKIILSNEKRILMTGVSRLKNNKIRFRRIKFQQHLQSDDYQVIGSIISNNVRRSDLILKFQMRTISGFSAVIEDLYRESDESDDGYTFKKFYLPVCINF